MACYSNWMQIVSLNGKWIFGTDSYQNSNPLIESITAGPGGYRGVLYSYLPHLLAVLVLVVFVSRILHWSLRFLRQPLVVCQLIAGIVIFSFLPKPKDVDMHGGDITMNPANRRVEHVLGSYGILFNLFMAGVKINPRTIWQFGKKKPLIIGCSSFFAPLAVGLIIILLKGKQIEFVIDTKHHNRYIILMLYPICSTYPLSVYDTMSELGLLNSKLSRLALSSAMLQLFLWWTILISYIVVKQGHESILKGFMALFSCLAIILIILFFIRPYALWIVRTSTANDRVRLVHIFMITFIVLMMGFSSDILGSTTFADTAFLTGWAIPDGPPLGSALMERVDLVPSELLTPLVFMHEGFVIDWGVVNEKLSSALWLGLLILVTSVAKIVANTAAALYCKMPLKNGILLGFIMNFRGFVDMLTLLSFINTKLMSRSTFTALVLSNTVITAICTPLVSIYYKPFGVRKQIGLRAVERIPLDAELSVMACFYNDKPVQALLDFLESSSFPLKIDYNSTCVYSLHLVEQEGRAVSSLTSHRNKKGYISTLQMDPVHNHFLAFEQTKRRSVSVIPLTSVARVNSMHQDICSLVLQKDIPLVLVPYPKKNSIAYLEADAAMLALVPLVLEKVPCSVGIMVYHGTAKITSHSYWQYRVGVLFWGGPDDREAIAIASRMARHPGVYLNIIRFNTSCAASDQSTQHTEDHDDDDHPLHHDHGNGIDRKISDDEMLAELQVANARNNRMTVNTVSVGNVDQVISAIQKIGDDKYDLLIVGRRQECLSVFGDELTKWTEAPELGAIGDLLATDISGIANVLIVQQHIVR